MRLEKEVVLDVWKTRQAEATTTVRALQAWVDELRTRKDRLVEAFVYRAAIDQETYERETLRINDSISEAQAKIDDARHEELDVEGVVRYAEYVALNAARLWQHADGAHKLALQAAVCPEGVRYGAGAFRTPVTSLFFRRIEASTSDASTVATLGG